MKKIIIPALFIIFLPAIYGAMQGSIEIQDFFIEQDPLYFNYSLISDEDMLIKIFPNIECESLPVKLLEEVTINLTKDTSYNGVYYDQTIGDWIQPQNCTASINFLEPLYETISQRFSINTIPSFDIELRFCQDIDCLKRTKVFIQNEKIYLDYFSYVEDPNIKAVVTYPDKKTKQLVLPTTIKAEQIGTHEIEVTASKAGYKSIIQKEVFGVIEGEVEIQPLFKEQKTNYLLFVIPTILITLIFIIFVFIRKKVF